MWAVNGPLWGYIGTKIEIVDTHNSSLENFVAVGKLQLSSCPFVTPPHFFNRRCYWLDVYTV